MTLRTPLIVAVVVTVVAATAFVEPDRPGMVLIPGGSAVLGHDNYNSLPGPQPYDVAAFLIDRFEVSNAQYRAYTDQTGAATPEFSDEPEYSQPDQPVTGIRWSDASAYCEWAGKRLPTEAEWEKAARGPDGGSYPWGEGFQADYAHLTGAVPVAITAYETDQSPYGVRGMAGNVSEWVSDTRTVQAGVCGAPHNHGDEGADADSLYLAELAALYSVNAIDICRNPDFPAEFAPLETCAFIKGNNWSGRPHMTVSSNRMWDYATSYADFVGFRCAATALVAN